jgi:hypothetical protein
VTLTSAAIVGGTRTDVTSDLGAYGSSRRQACRPEVQLPGFRNVARGHPDHGELRGEGGHDPVDAGTRETVTVSGEAPTVDSRAP